MQLLNDILLVTIVIIRKDNDFFLRETKKIE